MPCVKEGVTKKRRTTKTTIGGGITKIENKEKEKKGKIRGKTETKKERKRKNKKLFGRHAPIGYFLLSLSKSCPLPKAKRVPSGTNHSSPFPSK